jgi:FkbM family methyltransferase
VLELTMRHKLRRPGRRARTVRLRANGVPVTFELGDIGELHGVREVLVQGDYSLEPPAPPQVILDLGANIGAAAVYFATRWPEARIVALEPDPATFARLARNTSTFERVTALQLAVAGEAGEATLYRTGYTLTGSLVGGDGHGEPIAVETVSLDWLVGGPCEGRVDLVKFDVEGLELDVLRRFEARAEIPVLVGELHEQVMGGSLDEFAGLFPAHTVEISPLPNGEHLFRAWR